MIFYDYHCYGEKYDASFDEGCIIGFHNMHLIDYPSLMKWGKINDNSCIPFRLLSKKAFLIST